MGIFTNGDFNQNHRCYLSCVNRKCFDRRDPMLTLSSLLQPLSVQHFARDFWGSKMYFSKQQRNEISQLLSWDAMSHLLKDKAIYDKTEILLRSDSFDTTNRPNSYSQVMQGIEDGYTLQVRYLDRILPDDSPVVQFSKQIESVIMQPMDSITFFYSQPSSYPTAIHKDISEIFSLQIAGKKRWKITNEKCLTDQMCFEEGEITDWNEYTLEAGNFMYLASCLPHQVQCVDEPSISVAFVFSSIQMNSLLWYINENPAIKQLLAKPLPILGDPDCINVAHEKIRELFELQASHCDSMNSTEVIKTLQNQLNACLS